MTHEEMRNEARQWIAHIRRELVQLEDVMAHAEGFRGNAWNDSLMRCHQSAESALINALQLAIRRTVY